MTKTILMSASFLALLAAFPAFAADVKAEANANTETTGAKIERTLENTGKKIEKKTEEAGAAVREKYNDMKAYFAEDDVKAVSSININERLTADMILGANVQNPAGENIGTVEDILVNADGDAERVIINDGGVLGLGGKMASFDYSVIEGLNADEDVVVKLNEQSIKNATGFSYKAEKNADAKVAVMPADMFSVKEIIGSKVVDAEGKAVATVDTVAMEGDDADYLVVTFNKILGMGGDNAALDFDALDLTNNQGKYTFKLNTQQTAQFENYKGTAKAN